MLTGTIQKKIYLAISTLTLVAGLLLFFFTTGFIRFYGGDVLVVIFLYSLLSLVWDTLPIYRAGVIFLLAIAVEVAQTLFSPTNSALADLTIGSTFDPMDILAYLIGVIIVFSFDRFYLKPKISAKNTQKPSSS